MRAIRNGAWIVLIAGATLTSQELFNACSSVAPPSAVRITTAATSTLLPLASLAPSHSAAPDYPGTLALTPSTPAPPLFAPPSPSSTPTPLLLRAWGSSRDLSDCSHAPSVQIIMSDSRQPNVSMPRDSPPSLAAAINAAYAKRHGYKFSFYRYVSTEETADSRQGGVHGGAKADICSRNSAHSGSQRRTAWCKLLVLWAALQEEESLAACPSDVVLFFDSDAYITPSAMEVPFETWFQNVSVLRPSQLTASTFDKPLPKGSLQRWVLPFGWRNPAASFFFAANSPWCPQGPTSGTFAIVGVGSAAGRATVSALLATWWDLSEQGVTAKGALSDAIRSRGWNWDLNHPYEQTPLMAAVEAADHARLFDLQAADAATAISHNPFLALASHVRVLDMETFRDVPDQVIRHASSHEFTARLDILRKAASGVGLDGAALSLAVSSLPVFAFNTFAAESRLRENFLRMTSELDVMKLLSSAIIIRKGAQA